MHIKTNGNYIVKVKINFDLKYFFVILVLLKGVIFTLQLKDKKYKCEILDIFNLYPFQNVALKFFFNGAMLLTTNIKK